MIPLLIIIIILVVHFLADFVLQSHKSASRKHKDIGALLEHTISYSLPWLIIMALIYYSVDDPNFFIKGVLFTLVTFVSHTIIDYCTSKLGMHLLIISRKKENYHNYFVNIGFDQLLHTVLLFTTYIVILKG